MNTDSVQYNPLGNQRRKSFITSLEKGAQHIKDHADHIGGLKTPRSNANMPRIAEALHQRVGHQLSNMAKDIDRGSFGGVTELFSGLANAFNQVFRAADNDPDQHEYQNQVLSSVMKFLSTPGLKQTAYDLQDDLTNLVQTKEVSPTIALHEQAA